MVAKHIGRLCHGLAGKVLLWSMLIWSYNAMFVKKRQYLIFYTFPNLKWWLHNVGNLQPDEHKQFLSYFTRMCTIGLDKKSQQLAAPDVSPAKSIVRYFW